MMKLFLDFSALKHAVDKMGPSTASYDVDEVNTTRMQGIAMDLLKGLELGKDIPLEEITSDGGILEYDGHQVMLYIPDQGDQIQEVLLDGKQGRRIHVAECSTLELMRNTGRFGRYTVISRIDSTFPVYGSDSFSGSHVEGEAELGICQNCLKVLNYQGFADLPKYEKQKIFHDFDIQQFFENYSSYFKSLPLGRASSSASSSYTPDWANISRNVREEVGYCCEHCGVDLSSQPSLLHVHHVNGLKSDNERSNLKALCVDCHKKQPHHGHMHVKHKDVLEINKLRREQHKFDVFDYGKLKACADTALNGVIAKCERYRVPTGELGLCLKTPNGVVDIDLAWPKSKVAIQLSTEHKLTLEKAGWTVVTPHMALQNFQEFQRIAR